MENFYVVVCQDHQSEKPDDFKAVNGISPFPTALPFDSNEESFKGDVENDSPFRAARMSTEEYAISGHADQYFAVLFVHAKGSQVVSATAQGWASI